MRQGERRTADFILKNTSSSLIKVAQVMGHCSCTSHHLSSAAIAPGESTTLAITFDSGDRRGSTGTYATAYYVNAGDANLRAVHCRITANVEPNIVTSPDSVTFTSGRAATAIVTLRPNKISRFRVTDVACSNSAFTAHCRPRDNPSSPCEIEVAFNPDQISNRGISAELTIRTDDPAAAVLFVRLTETAVEP